MTPNAEVALIYQQRSIPDTAADMRPAYPQSPPSEFLARIQSAYQQPEHLDTQVDIPQTTEEKHNATEMAQGMLLVRLTSLIEGIPADQQAAFEQNVIDTYNQYTVLQLGKGQTVDQAHNSTQKEFLYTMHSHLYQAQFGPHDDAQPLPREQFDTAYQEGIEMVKDGFDVWDPHFNFENTDDISHGAPVSPEEAEDLVQWRMMYNLVRDIYKGRSNRTISPAEFQHQMNAQVQLISEGKDPLTINWMFGQKEEPKITIEMGRALDNGPIPFSHYGSIVAGPKHIRS